MNKLKDIMGLAQESLGQSVELIKQIPILLAVPVVHFMAYFGVINLGILRLGMFSGILLSAVSAAILSSYLYVLHQAIYYKRFKFAYLYQGIKVMFIKSWFFLVIFNLVNYLLSMTGVSVLLGVGAAALPFLLFNPMPEIIYISEYDQRDMFYYNFTFIKKNFLPWYTINLFLLIGLLALLFIGGLIIYVANMLLVVYLGFVMIFRGYLFKKLHSSNIRKRQFERFNR